MQCHDDLLHKLCILVSEPLLFSFELCEWNVWRVRRMNVSVWLAIFFWIMPSTLATIAASFWSLAIFFWIMLVKVHHTCVEQNKMKNLLFSFELCIRLCFTIPEVSRVRKFKELAIFFWIMLVANYRTKQASKQYANLLFSFELCVREERLEGVYEDAMVVLLFSFELCLKVVYNANLDKAVLIACYFLLNYAGWVGWERGWLGWKRTCYFLLNYAPTICPWQTCNEPLLWLAIFFWIMLIANVPHTRHGGGTCYFLLNYAAVLPIHFGLSPYYRYLLFSFELCPSWKN